ncbi:activator of the mannose operon, transcriptional antiterminator [Pelagirhabdus alkalitolerans]|uniref:Activator of the mannose operon, transcriptional antiterminator n=1 Tax=Pelagirhabdus alkalitolerans TaxID=1612202 RepID=A0A1G6KZ37_9BACI|nr:BglG family transcription antiterminator [Pelagirhabdus alkalitolerans]SDC36081.1 activator of the mannose operon, transcriptional antiterminator [Pelagirhabdus alkalitolerans]
MNDRQKEIVQYLLQQKEDYHTIDDLTKVFDCSEKTIRTDFKKIDQILSEQFNATLIRRPGVGVTLSVSENEIDQLNQFSQTDKKVSTLTEEDSIKICYQLLMATKPLTIQDLANDYFVSKGQIKKVLDELEDFLSHYQLKVVSKQKVGIIIEGKESQKRTALVMIDQLRQDKSINQPYLLHFFYAYELDLVRKALQQFQDSQMLIFTDESFEGIVLHILLMVRRIKLNQMIQVSKDDQDFISTKHEYEGTKALVSDIETSFKVRIPEPEIVYLTMHILGAKRTNEPDSFFDVEMEKRAEAMTQELTRRLSILTLIPFEQDPVLKEGLVVHLYSTLNRLTFDLHVENPLVQDIKKMYPYLFDMILLSIQEMNTIFPEDEVAYLTLHYQASYERIMKTRQTKTTIGIICHMGIGTSEILRSKLERYFTSIEVVSIGSKREVKAIIKDNDPDLFVSTVPLEIEQPPHIVVSPLLNEDERRRLSSFLTKASRSAISHSSAELAFYIDEAHLFLNITIDHRYKLIEKMAERLHMDGFVDKEYIHQALRRERTASTVIGGGIAIPHGDPKYVKHSAIAVATLNQPLDWDGEKVSLVFLLAIKHEKDVSRKELYQRLTVLAEQPSHVQALINLNDKQAFIEKI